MKQVHVECTPDELLIKKLGFQRKFITHHNGKSKVFQVLSKNSEQLAMVDEDPGSNNKTTYEKGLRFVAEVEGIKKYQDTSGNKVFILKGKLEDWIIDVCKRHKVKNMYGLPSDPHGLHEVINQRLPNLGNLIDDLLENKNPALIQLKNWLE